MGLLDQFAGLFGKGLGQLGPEVAPQLLQAVTRDSRFGGMGGLLQHLADSGLGGHVDSWTDPDKPSEPVSANQIQQALGGGELANIAGQLGITPEAASQFLAQHLPAAAAAHAENEGDEPSEPH
jgi:uncharacterized protein YidB (DUF937 family)